ncbi:MAG: ATP-binding protein [Prevotella sp.]|nr:ATP-binding protein [Prevotella sp.]MDE6353755.1 ATP-binding protein [Prevotella sp.]
MTTIPRLLQKEIERRIRAQKVMLLFGARRVGKTVLLRQIAENYGGGRTLMLNGESMDTVRLLEDRSSANYRRLFGGLSLLAIDEAQHIPDVGMKLKLIVDELPELAVIATGSSSFDLQNRAGEPLVGRSTQFMLTPLSVEEMAAAETRFETMLNTDHRVVYGHYPELTAMASEVDKREYLTDVVDAYLLRDILAIDGVKHTQKLHDLLRLVAWQVGSEVSMDELARQLTLSRNTVDRYLDLLQKVFVLYRVGGYSRNLRKEIAKSSKWYFQDTGVRNAVLRDFRPLSERPEAERGALWENYVISERMKRNLNHRLGLNFYFWRTYDKAEIDLIEEDGMRIDAYEIKAGVKRPSVPKSFAVAYPDAGFHVINRDTYMDYLV